MNVANVLVGICSLLFLMVGADKFFGFLEPPCSLMGYIPSIVWQILGVMQIAAGILIWMPKYRRFVVGFFAIFMITFSIVHLAMGTQDIGGAAFMAVLLGLLLWDPSFIRAKS